MYSLSLIHMAALCRDAVTTLNFEPETLNCAARCATTELPGKLLYTPISRTYIRQLI